jgi:hypothetical protein
MSNKKNGLPLNKDLELVSLYINLLSNSDKLKIK